MAIVNAVKKKILDAEVNFVTDTIKGMLLNDSHTTNIDTQEFIDDVSTNEISGTGYSAGGFTLSNKSVTVDNTDNESVFDADDVTLSSATITFRYLVIYKDTGTPSTSPIISIIDFGSNQVATTEDVVFQWATEGILNLG